MVQSPLRIGSYDIERLLGLGSFATVWLGLDPTLGAHVAIKVLAENWSHDLRVRERFLDEGRLLWRLDHERLVRVHAVGELPDGRPYLVMAWARGGSLRERLATGALPVRVGLSVLREIAAGVAVLHANGIVHRDLTPGNILFQTPHRDPVADPGPAGQVLIADLGLAKALAAASGLTARAGTPGFMAPEQDDPLAIVDARTDVYGLGRLGVVLLCTATRTPGMPPLRAGVPAAVGRVLRRATAHEAAGRHPDAAAFAAALDRATGAPVPPTHTLRRTGRIVALGAVVLIAVSGAQPAPRRPVDARATAPERPRTDQPRPASTPRVAPEPTPTPSVPAATTAPAARSSPTPAATSARRSASVSRSPSPSPSDTACFGPLVHTLPADTELALVTALCLRVGSVLRIQGTGPDTVSATPAAKVVMSYEAATVDCRLVETGTVTVVVLRDDRSYPITVVVV